LGASNLLARSVLVVRDLLPFVVVVVPFAAAAAALALAVALAGVVVIPNAPKAVEVASEEGTCG
jgi:hypothetical protein